jgi:hypothetical protein
VYDGQLKSALGLDHQALVLGREHHNAVRSTGIRFWPVDHDACAQKSEEEATEICALYDSLLGQQWRDRHGEQRDITAEDILVVAPYNMQVNLLRQKLPAGARVGTVDKFQGRIVLSKALLTATNRARPLRSGSTGVDARLRNGPDQLASRVDPACRTLESPSFPPCPAPSTIGPAPLPLRRCRSASGSGADDPRVSLTPACPAAVAPARRSARAQAQPPRIPDPDARG